jgi:hypothetical protein
MGLDSSYNLMGVCQQACKFRQCTQQHANFSSPSSPLLQWCKVYSGSQCKSLEKEISDMRMLERALLTRQSRNDEDSALLLG